MQKKRHSLLETCLGTTIGFVIAMLVWRWIAAPIFKLPVDLSTNFYITSLFTIVSIIRGYFVRRLFNWLHVKELL